MLAATANACSVNGDSPFFDLCYLAQEKNLKAFRLGWKQSAALFATQAEYRLELVGRIGAAGFIGVRQVATESNHFQKDAWPPGLV